MGQKYPGGADAAIEALARLRAELEQCRPGQDPAETRDAWLNLSTRPFGLLNREIDIWIGRFGDEIARLQALKWFAECQGQIVVPDASALIQGPGFAGFDWHSLPGVAVPAGPLRLIIPILVIEELDALKRDGADRVRERARAALTELWELHGTAPGVPVALPGQQVTVEIFLDEPWHVRRPVHADEIIGRAQAIEAITGKRVIMAAGDHAMLYRAAAAGLTAVLLPGQREAVAAPGETAAQG